MFLNVGSHVTTFPREPSLTVGTAEFRGPGIHHRFDDSPDDYDMDMDQRTRMLGGGRGGRIILLGDGTEVVTDHAEDDGDVDMEDRGEAEEEEEKDLQEQVKKGQAQAKSTTNGPVEERNTREETPAPSSQSQEATSKVTEVSPSPELLKSSSTPDEPKMSVPVDTPNAKKTADKLQAQK